MNKEKYPKEQGYELLESYDAPNKKFNEELGDLFKVVFTKEDLYLLFESLIPKDKKFSFQICKGMDNCVTVFILGKDLEGFHVDLMFGQLLIDLDFICIEQYSHLIDVIISTINKY